MENANLTSETGVPILDVSIKEEVVDALHVRPCDYNGCGGEDSFPVR